MLPTLVLLPGLDGTGDLFAPLLVQLGSETRTIVVRYPTGEVLNYDALAALVKAQLPDSGSFVLLAESFSGPIAISLAAMQPGKLLGLILCTSFARNPRPILGPILCKTGFVSTGYLPTTMMNAAMLNEFSLTDLSRQLVGAVSKVTGKVLQARLKAVVNIDVSDKLDRVIVPSLYLRASHDRLVPKHAGELIIRNRKNWQLAELFGPHLLLQTVPHEAAEVIREFVQSLTAESAAY